MVYILVLPVTQVCVAGSIDRCRIVKLFAYSLSPSNHPLTQVEPNDGLELCSFLPFILAVEGDGRFKTQHIVIGEKNYERQLNTRDDLLVPKEQLIVNMDSFFQGKKKKKKG